MVLGGSGYKKCNLLEMLLTADLKYHQFYEAENQLLWQILDILKANAIQKIILLIIFEKILNFAIILSEENTNPVKYL
jgi:N-glycosylase/DNA lyase